MLQMQNGLLSKNSHLDLCHKSGAKESKFLKINILVVEDTFICHKVILMFLEKLGFTTDLATSGRDALFKYQQKNFNLILLDLGLPDISGIEVCKKIRKEMYDKDIPIIAYSANADTSADECIDAGFNYVLEKPSEEKILEKVIKDFIRMN